MAIASKTVLLQMRFIGRGAAFVNVGAKSTISQVGQYRLGSAFYGVSNTETPVSYSFARSIVRLGASGKVATAKSSIDAHYGRISNGTPFWVKFDGTSVYVSLKKPVRQGLAFVEVVSKDSINAEGFDVYRQGAPFWVRYNGAPPPFNAARFFLFF